MMSDVPLHDVSNHVFLQKKEEALVEAAASIANAIHIGVGGMIRGTMMEDELRKALGLVKGDLVNIPKR